MRRHLAVVAFLAAAVPALPGAQAARGVVVDIQVTDRAGLPIEHATVRLEGLTSREAATNAKGVVSLQNVRAGIYRVRIERDGFITLEKEATIRAGVRASIEAALSPAPLPTPSSPLSPEPPAPPAPEPAPPPLLLPGAVAVMSIPVLAERMLKGREPVAESVIGCSGATLARVIMLRELLEVHVHDAADEMLYVVAGDAVVTVGERQQTVSAGWFCIVPRTMSHTVTRRGRNPVILLSVISGEPCQGRVP